MTEVPADASYALVVESVGGAVLGAALQSVAPDGLVVSFGNSSGQPTTFDVSRFLRAAAPASTPSSSSTSWPAAVPAATTSGDWR